MFKIGKKFFPFVLAALISVGYLPATPRLEESLMKWPQGKRIHVVLKDGEDLVGRLGTVQVDSFRLDPDSKKGSARTLRVDDVRTVSTKMTKAQKWGIGAAVYGTLCIIGIILGK